MIDTNLDYNTQRTHMIMKEYGRNIHKMVDYLLTIEEDNVRQEKTEALVKIMSNLIPQPKNIEDPTNLFWDHIIIMSDFKLKVNSPYPYPTREEVYAKPDLIPYPKKKLKFKHFGKNFELVLEKALEETDENKKKEYIKTLAYYMKLAYQNWHQESIHDDLIREEFKKLSGGKLEYTQDIYVKVSDNNKQPNIKNNLSYKRPVKKNFGSSNSNNNNNNKKKRR